MDIKIRISQSRKYLTYLSLQIFKPLLTNKAFIFNKNSNISLKNSSPLQIINIPQIFQLISFVLGLLTIIISILVMIGWLGNFDLLRSTAPIFSTMKFNSALCFLFSGLSLCIYQIEGINSFRNLINRIFLLLIAIIALLSLSQYITGINIGIDQFFAKDYIASEMLHPGRMSLATGSTFCFIVAAFIFLDPKIQFWKLAQSFGLLSLLMGSVSLIGYIYGIKIFLITLYSFMAIHTSGLFIFIGLGILFSKPQHGFMAVLTSKSIGGKTAIKIFPIITLIPILFCWLSFKGIETLNYGVQFGFAFASISCIFVLWVMLFLSAKYLNRMQAEIDLVHKEQEFLASIVQSSEDAIISKDLKGNILSWNLGAEKIYGYTKSEMIGQKMGKLFPPNRIKEEKQILQDIKLGRHIEHIETTRLNKSGRLFDVSLTVSPVRNKQNIIIGASHVSRDISDRIEIQKELIIKAEELTRSNQDLEQFAYVASHDLQEPLRAVSGCVQLLQQRYQAQFDDHAQKLMQHAVDGAARMQNLIEDLLMYSQIGQAEEQFEETDLNRVLDITLTNLYISIKESRAEIIRPKLPTIYAVPTQVTLLLQNLISNAIKFRQIENTVKIQIHSELKNGSWVFSVSDNGIGIEKEYFEKIFTIFQRLNSRKLYGGTGLGLALCKRIIEHHRGQIWVESTLGIGTTIFFTLADRSDSDNRN
ncbi:MAG: PAS domain S-box protein [Pseudomonadota bacterium]